MCRHGCFKDSSILRTCHIRVSKAHVETQREGAQGRGRQKELEAERKRQRRERSYKLVNSFFIADFLL